MVSKMTTYKKGSNNGSEELEIKKVRPISEVLPPELRYKRNRFSLSMFLNQEIVITRIWFKPSKVSPTGYAILTISTPVGETQITCGGILVLQQLKAIKDRLPVKATVRMDKNSLYLE